MDEKNNNMTVADQAFVEEIDAVYKKHGKMLVPHIEAVFRIVALPKAPEAPQAPNGAVTDSLVPPAPTTAEIASAGLTATGSVVSPIQASDLGAGSGPVDPASA